MSPKEKAKSLVDRMERSKDMPYQYAKQCAKIAVDELLSITAPYCNRYEEYYENLDDEMTQHYWEQVKHEIELL